MYIVGKWIFNLMGAKVVVVAKRLAQLRVRTKSELKRNFRSLFLVKEKKSILVRRRRRRRRRLVK